MKRIKNKNVAAIIFMLANVIATNLLDNNKLLILNAEKRITGTYLQILKMVTVLFLPKS
jgi:hypothetical protein